MVGLETCWDFFLEKSFKPAKNLNRCGPHVCTKTRKINVTHSLSETSHSFIRIIKNPDFGPGRNVPLTCLQVIWVKLSSSKLIFKITASRWKSLKFGYSKFLFWQSFRETISLPGKTSNHLKFRYFERASVVIKLGVKRSFGIFISAECECFQNAHNRNFTCHWTVNNSHMPLTKESKTSYFQCFLLFF